MRLTRSLIWGTWIEARRGGLFRLGLVLFLILAGAAELLAASLPTEAPVTRLITLAALCRLAWVFVIAIFVTSSVQREESDQVQLWLMSLPLPRHRYLSARAWAYASLAAASPVPLGVCFALYAGPGPALAWTLGLAAELVLVALLSQACALALRQAPVALSAVALAYLFARSLDALRLIAASPLLMGQVWAGAGVRPFLDGLAWVVPPLARFAPSAWLLEPPAAGELLAVLAQTGASAFLLYALMRVDIARRGV